MQPVAEGVRVGIRRLQHVGVASVESRAVVLKCPIADLQQGLIEIRVNVIKLWAIRRNLHEAIERGNVHTLCSSAMPA